MTITDTPIRRGDKLPGHVLVLLVRDENGAVKPSAYDLDRPFLGLLGPVGTPFELMTKLEFKRRFPGLTAV